LAHREFCKVFSDTPVTFPSSVGIHSMQRQFRADAETTATE
jgi:hypothetical protein